jgi:hypothetical protein
MTSCITASIELATLGRSHLTYIPQSAILARTNASLRCPVHIFAPRAADGVRKELAPDAIFGLEYQTSEGSKFRFFAVEADRATEPTTSSTWNRKSFLRNLQQYDAYVADGAYRTHLSLSAPLLVLTVVSDHARMKRMIELTGRHHSTGNAFMLFQAWDDFGPVFRPPQPDAGLLHEGWSRSGLPPFFIDSL